MRVLGPLAVIVALAALVGACGGDDDAGNDAPTQTVVTYVPPEGPTLEEWQAQATAVCEEYEPKQAAIVAAHPQSTDPADVIALLDELGPVATAYQQALEAVPIPAERHRDIERALAISNENFQAGAEFREAAARDDTAGMQAAAESLEAQSTELTSLLTDLGVPACA